MEIDEDLIPAFKCIDCKRGVCKDEVFKRLDGMDCICIDCGIDEKEEAKADLKRKYKDD